MFHQFDLDANNVLDHKEIGNVNATLFNIFPRFGYKGKEPPGEILLQCNHIFYYDIFRSKISLKIYNFIVVYNVFQMVDLRVTIDKLF